MEPREEDDERTRVEEAYGAYRTSRRKRRAWSRHNRGNRAMHAELADVIWRAGGRHLTGDAGATGRVLDAGCGTGQWLVELIQRGVAPGRLHGVDILPERVEAARGRTAAAVEQGGGEAKVELRDSDLRDLPYPDSYFDAVLLIVVLSSLASREDALRALREIKRVTCPGGVVIVYEPRHRSPNRRTLHVPPALVGEILGPVSLQPVTVWPPLARRLGRLTDRLYPRLSGRRSMTSHAVTVHRV